MAEPPDLTELYDFQTKDPQQALDAALAQVRTYCRWHIAPSVSATASVWSLDGYTLFLPSLYVTAVASLTQDSAVIASSKYTFESYGLIKATPGNYFSTLSKVDVAFTHGYTTLPNDVRQVLLGFAQRSISDNRGMIVGQGSTGAAALVANHGPEFTDADKKKLAPYVATAGFA